MESGLPATESGRLQPSAAFPRDLPKSQDPAHTTGSNPEPSTTSKCQLQICPSTGGGFVLRVDLSDRVDLLKAIIGQRLRIQKERIHLLFKDRILSVGTLRENGIGHDSKITLLPTVHAGLKSPKSDHSMVQALENLSDGQVNDFICGRSPLTLAMRMGDHMMFVQLQLSTSPPSGRSPASRSSAVPLRMNKSCSSSASSTPPSSPESSPAPSPFSSPESSTSSSPSFSALPSSSSGSRFAFPPSAALESSRAEHALGSAAPSPVPSPPHRTPVCMLRGGNGAASVSALENAKRSLSLKLREFSQQANSTCSSPVVIRKDTPRSPDLPVSPSPSSSSSTTTSNPSSAIIESMQHLGHGVYSGTFSGTLNPQLQDLDGRPKRSINTIIHILNDLLGASPGHAATAAAAAAAAATALKRRHTASTVDATSTSVATAGCPPPSKRAKQEHEENAVMRAKVEQLQMMLEQRRLKKRRSKATGLHDLAEDREEAEPGIVLS